MPAVRPAIRTNVTRALVALLGTLLVLTAVGIDRAPVAMAAPPQAAFSWRMPDRFGADANGDHVIDQITTSTPAEVVNPTSWPIEFDACAGATPGATYSWSFAGSPPTPPTTDCRTTHAFPTVNVSYDVSLTVTANGESATTTQTILPRDYVFVAMGDSGASGEGNPDWLEPDFSGSSFSDVAFGHRWANEQCHRSNLAGPAQAALRLEQRDPHSSITFVHTACSGARITRGLIGPYQGIEPTKERLDCDDPNRANPYKPGEKLYIKVPDSAYDAPNPTDPACMKPQVQQVSEILRGRPIDALSILIGINDVQFSKVVMVCLLEEDCSTVRTTGLLSPDGRAQTATEWLTARFAQLQDRYAVLADTIIQQLPLNDGNPALGIAPGKVWFGEYPNPTQDAAGNPCSSNELDFVTSWSTAVTDKVKQFLNWSGQSHRGVVSATEWAWARDNIILRLAEETRIAAEAANARYPGRFGKLAGSTAAFAGHGYCTQDRWFRVVAESFLYQRDQEGSFHPNRAGHFFAYALPIEQAVATQLGITAPALPPHVPGEIETFEAASQGLAPLFDVLSRTDLADQLAKLWPERNRRARGDRPSDSDKDAFSVVNVIRSLGTKVRDLVVDMAVPEALSTLDAKLDDLDGVNGEADDGHVGPFVLDVQGRVTPHTPAQVHEVLVDLKITGPAAAFLLDAGGVRLESASPTLTVSTQLRFFVDLTRPRDRVYLRTKDQPKITVALTAKQVVPASAPVSARFGPIEVAAHGPASGAPAVDIATALTLTPRDPNGNGEISSDELVNAAFSGAFDVACAPTSHVNLDVTLEAGLPGITGEVAHLVLDDPSTCDGLDEPDLTLADPNLDGLQDLNPTDVVDVFVALAQALDALQQQGDLDLPFTDAQLSDALSAAKVVKDFLVAAGYTSASDPLQATPLDPEARRQLSIEQLVRQLEQHLGLPAGALQLRFDLPSRRLLLNLSTGASVSNQQLTLDAGLLERAGIKDATGGATVNVSANGTLQVQLAVDTTPDPDGTPTDQLRTITDRLLVGTAGTQLTFDAQASVAADAAARIGIVPVQVQIGSAQAPAQLLTRRDPAKPLLTVRPTTGSGPADGFVSLADILSGSPDRAGLSVQLNGSVPATTATAVARLHTGGPELGRGTVTFRWDDLATLTGPAGPQVTADAAFNRDLIRFADSAMDPSELIGLVLAGVRDASATVVAVAKDNEDLARSLPVVGTGFDDVVATFTSVSQAAARLADAHARFTITDLEAALEAELATAFGITPQQAASIIDLDLDRSQPRTALVVHLNLCVASQAAADCQAAKPLKGSFTLDVDGLGLVGASGTAALALDYLARLRLDVAVELPAVTVGPDGPKVVTGEAAPSLVVLGSSGVTADLRGNVDLSRSPDGTFRVFVGPYEASLGITGTKAGQAFSDPAQAAASVRFRVGTGGPADERLTPAQFVAKVQQNLTANGVTTSEGRTDATCNGQPAGLEACAVLPVYFKTAAGDVTAGGATWVKLGDQPITFTATKLLDTSTYAADVPDAILTDLQNRAMSVTSVIEAVRWVLVKAKTALDGATTGASIPLVGDALDAGADVAAKVDQVLARLQGFAAQVESKTSAGSIKTSARDFLYRELGPGTGLNLVVDRNGDGLVSNADVVVTPICDGQPCADSAPLLDIDEVRLGISLGQNGKATAPPVDFGIPGLRLTTTGNAEATVSWRLDVNVGLDRNGIFFDPTNLPGRDGELTVRAGASLPTTLDATIAGLPLQLTDNTPAAPDLDLQLGADLLGSAPIRLTELINRGSDAVSAQNLRLFARGCAALDVGFALRTPSVGGASSSSLPGLLGRFDLDADWNGCPGSSGAPVDIRQGLDPVASFAIRDLRVDIGKTASDFVGPALREIRKVTGPVEPVVRALDGEIPVVSDVSKLAGKGRITWMDALITAQEANGDDATLLKVVLGLIRLTNRYNPTTAPKVEIPIADDIEIDLSAASSIPSSPDEAFDKLLTGTPIGRDLMQAAEDAGWTIRSDVESVTGGAAEAELTFPVLDDPMLLVKMLFGKDVDLVRFDAGRLHAGAGFDVSYGLPFAKVGIRGNASVEGHLRLAYDTAGIRAFFSKKPLAASNLTALVQGFGIYDVDDSGNDIPEIELDASLVLYAYAGVPGFNAEVSGGLEGWVDVDLIDPDGDGKLRTPEIAKRISNPICLFDTSGRIQAFARVKVNTGPFSGTKDIVEPYVFLEMPSVQEWCAAREAAGGSGGIEIPVPVLAERRTDGTLDINVGTRASRRNLGGSVDESVVVTDLGGGTVEVAMLGTAQQYGTATAPVTSVQASMGDGNDTFVLRGPAGPGDSTIPLIVHGDTGNDTITGGNAADRLFGEAGDDVVNGKGGDDILLPDDGNDVVNGGDGRDSINGGFGDDRINGGNGDDTIYPQNGADTVDGGPGTDYINGNQNLQNGTATGPDRLLGGEGKDTIEGSPDADIIVGGYESVATVGPWDSLFGRGGNDCIVDGDGMVAWKDGVAGGTCEVAITSTSPEKDNLYGDEGDDWLFAGPGIQQMLGGAGNDHLDAGDGDDIVKGEAGDDWLHGRDGVDDIDGGTGNDWLFGGNGADSRLVGMDGDDHVYGEAGDELGTTSVMGNNGNDVVDGGDGNDLVQAGVGDDTASGGPGNDTVRGDEGSDTVIGGDGNDQLYGDGTTTAGYATDGPDVVYGGAGNDWLLAGNGDDRVDMGDGDDTVDAGNGNDTVLGGEGSDKLVGMAGDDTIDGGPGPDAIGGDVVKLNERTTPPTRWPSGAFMLTPLFDQTVGGVDTLTGGGGDDFLYDVELTPPTYASSSTWKLVVTDPVDHGTLTTSAPTQSTYTATAGYKGSDEASFRLTHPTTGATLATGRMVVLNPGNRPPAPVDDAFMVDQGRTLTANVRTNDSDPDGDAVTVVPATGSSAGATWALTADGTLTYVPQVTFTGPTDAITYSVTDGQGGTATATATVTIRRDAAPPEVSCPTPSGWQATDVTITCEVRDTGVGLGADQPGTISLTTSMGAGHEGTAQVDPPVVCDAAGTCVDPDAIPVQVDRKGPSVTSGNDGVTYPAGTAGVVKDVSCTDGGSGIAPGGCPGAGEPLDLTPGEHTFDVTATDMVGNTTTATFRYVVEEPDTTAPVVSCPAPAGWSAAEVTVTCTVTDDGPLADGQASTYQLTTAVGAGNEGPASLDPPAACDAAGNCTDPAPFTVLVDRKGPSVTSANDGVTYPAGTTGVVKDVQCADAGSGMAADGCPGAGSPLDLTVGLHAFQVTATDAVGNTTTATFTYTVAAPPPVAMVSVGDAGVHEGDSGRRTLLVPVTLSAPAERSVTVTYTVTAGTASSKDVSIPGKAATLTFPVDPATGRTGVVQYVSITTAADNLAEADETVLVKVVAVTGAGTARAVGTGTILDDDRAGTTGVVGIGDVTVVEGDQGTRVARVRVTLLAAQRGPVSVSLATTGGTAAGGQDYVLTATTVVIPKGAVEATVDVPILPDSVVEPTETVEVVVRSSTAAVLDGKGVITILDDEQLA